MTRKPYPILLLLLISFLFLSGCATTRARRTDTADLSAQATELQVQLAAKDQQIQELEDRLASYERSIYSPSGSTASSWIRVPGVSVKDVQLALLRAGFDPGPADGKMGKKTKAAIKQFQQRHSLKADGIVGERTWSLLK